MSITLVNLIISIAIILIVIMKLRWNAVLGLLLGSIYMGLASGLGLVKTASAISNGFGNLMGSIGLPIGLGVILGQLLADSGGASVIAKTLVKKAGKKYALYAIGIATLIVSIPVFFDITFIILVPIGIALAKQVEKPLYYVVGAMAVGAGTGHTLIPPTPNPLAAASILNFDLGYMVVGGLLIGLPAVIVSITLLFKLYDRGIWKDELDCSGQPSVSYNEPDMPPSFSIAMVPIILPILLILSGTVSSAIYGKTPPLLAFLGDKTIAMLISTISMYFIASRYMKKEQVEDSVNKSLQAAGIVLLITGAGGSFGNIIQSTNIGESLLNLIGLSTDSTISVILLSYFIAFIFRVAQGSGTVASITAMQIMAQIAPMVKIHPLWIAMACLAGGISIGHINDSGFWVTANLSGFSVSGGLKTYTLGEFLVSIFVLLIVLLMTFVLPTF